MTDGDTTARTRARAPGVGGVIHRMAVHDRVLRPDSERSTVATTRCTKGGCKLDGGRRMPGAGLGTTDYTVYYQLVNAGLLPACPDCIQRAFAGTANAYQALVAP